MPAITQLPESSEGIKVLAAKEKAEELASRLDSQNKIEQLIEMWAEADIERYKIKHISAEAGAPSDLEECVGKWVQSIRKRAGVRGVREKYIVSAILLCCLQIRMEKLSEKTA